MPQPRVLILDDDPVRHATFDRLLSKAQRHHVYTAPQAIRTLETHPVFDVVFLDHDLPQSEKFAGPSSPGNGLDVANFIATELPRAKRPGHVWIHSWNIDGRKKMACVLRNASISVTIQRFRY